MRIDEQKFRAALTDGFAALTDEFNQNTLIPKLKALASQWNSTRDYRDGWGDEIASLIYEFEKHDSTFGTVYRKVGIPDRGEDDATTTKARVVAYGSGFNSLVPGYNEPIKTKPGKMVWGSRLENGKHPSKAKSEYEVPGNWNDVGNDFVVDAVLQLKKEFINFIEQNKDAIVMRAFKQAFTMGG